MNLSVHTEMINKININNKKKAAKLEKSGQIIAIKKTARLQINGQIKYIACHDKYIVHTN